MASFFLNGREIKGVAFDMDGTLVDCEPPNRIAVQGAVSRAFQIDWEKYKGMQHADIIADIKEEYGHDKVTITTDDFVMACETGHKDTLIQATIQDAVSKTFKINWSKYAGVKEADILAGIKEEYGADKIKVATNDFVAACKKGYEEALSTMKARPGMMELLNTLKELGVPIIVVTNSDTVMAKKKLEQCDMIDYMYDIIGSDTIAELGLRPKPAPDGYIKAAEMLGIKDYEMMGFEDSPVGLIALQATQALDAHIGDHGTPVSTTATVQIDGRGLTDMLGLNNQIRRENYKQLLGIKDELAPQPSSPAYA